MKEIKLGQRMFSCTKNKVTLVDDEDYEYLNQWSWSIHRNTSIWYVKRTDSKGHSIYMHRVIMNTPKDLVVDHKDHNGLNNQKYNLRSCSYSQNGQNMRSRTKYKGVSKTGHRYTAQIMHNRKHIYLGIFETEEKAALVYNTAARKYFGEFAKLNIIVEAV